MLVCLLLCRRTAMQKNQKKLDLRRAIDRLPTTNDNLLFMRAIFLFMYMCLVNSMGMGDGMDC